MSERLGNAAWLELWNALGQIIPRIESPDTLGTIVATALREMIGVGQVAVLLHNYPLTSESQKDDAPTYLLRPIGEQNIPRHPIYVGQNAALIARLADLDEPLYLERPWPAGYAAGAEALLELADERIVLAPIPGGDSRSTPTVPGAICLIDVPPARQPSPIELAALAGLTGVSLDLITTKAEAARQSIEYSIISEIGHSLTSTLSLDDIFEKILSSVRSAIDAESVSVALIEAGTEDIVFQKSMMGPKFSALPPFRLKKGQGVAGWVAENGQTVNVHDAYQDDRFYQGVDNVSGFVTRSILCVPLTVEDEVIGILEALNKRTGHFTKADQRLLLALGASAAIAIEKANLHADVLADKRRMDAIFANMGEGLMTINLAGLISTINPALQRMVGRPESDLIGRSCDMVIHTEPNVLSDLVAQMQTTSSISETFHAACDLVRLEGTRIPVMVNGAMTVNETDERTTEIVVVFSDISQIRELERMKDDFVTNVTHELRTPLAAILLYARLLRSGKARSDPQREARYLEIVEQQSNQLQKLVRKILDISRMEAMLIYPSHDQVSLPALLDELVPPFEKLAQQRGVELVTDVPSDLPIIHGNQEALRLALKNLIDNAIKFTPEGQVVVSARLVESGIEIDVCDEGIGIAPESIPHLFQRFYRTKAAVERGIGGTGLGLALVKETIEKLGGAVRVTSQLGKGSTFHVFIPLVNPVQES